VGDYASVDAGVDDVFAYWRTADGVDRFLVVLNFGSDSYTLNLSHVVQEAAIAVATDMVRSGQVDLSHLMLRPNEGLILRLD
jgi:hypothetical protein